VRAQWDELKELTAVRRGRVVALEEDFMERPGPRVVAMVEAVARALHPELTWPVR
jgi:ABC-type Fe3+-hydroxamate transport system substrate-binding protein